MHTVLRIIWFFIQIGFLLAFFYLFLRIVLVTFSFRWGIEVPFVPTPKKVIDRMLEELALKEGSKAVDLGSGDGRLVLRVAKKCAVDVTGIEYSRVLYLLSRLHALIPWRKGKVRLMRGDMYEFDLKGFDTVFMFLLPEAMQKLRAKLESSLANGTQVVTYLYPFDSPLFKGQEFEIDEKRKFYIYTKIK